VNFILDIISKIIILSLFIYYLLINQSQSLEVNKIILSASFSLSSSSYTYFPFISILSNYPRISIDSYSTSEFDCIYVWLPSKSSLAQYGELWFSYLGVFNFECLIDDLNDLVTNFGLILMTLGPLVTYGKVYFDGIGLLD